MILSSLYFAPISQFALYVQKGPAFKRDIHEHFTKQSYRNRCEIMAANKVLSLSIPLKKYANNTAISAIEISYDENWPALHWKSIESAYRKAPFFEYYADRYYSIFFEQQEKFLIDFNSKLESKLSQDLKIELQEVSSESYEEQYPDWRCIINPKTKTKKFTFPHYYQVFEERHGFVEDLSIIDLLFNLGPSARDYLNRITISEE